MSGGDTLDIRGYFKEYVRITLTSIRTPRKFFEEVKGEGKNYSKPLAYMLISIHVYLLGFHFLIFFLGHLSNVINRLYEIFKSLAELSTIILFLVFIFIALVHLTNEIIGGKSKFHQTFKVICYSFSPLNFALIITIALLATLYFKNFIAQLIGALLALILLAVLLYILYMITIGISVTSAISITKAFLAVVIQVFITVLILTIISYVSVSVHDYGKNNPVEDEPVEWIEIGPYDIVENHVELAGKIAFVSENNCNNFIVYNGNEGTHYDKIENLRNINGNIAFNAMKNGKWVFVYDWNESGMPYDQIENTIEIGGKITHFVKNNGRNLIVYDGKEIENQYDSVWPPIDIGGNLTYMAERNGTKIIVHNGKEIGTQYDAVFSPVDIGGNLTYIARNGNNYLIVNNGKEERKSHLIWELMNIGGKLAYRGLDSNSKSFVVHDGKKGKSYGSISHLTDINGKPAYYVKDGRKGFIVYDGKEMGTQYPNMVEKVTDINGTPAYNAFDGKSWFIVYGENEVGKQYDYAVSPTNVSGKLAYIARKNNSAFFVYDGEEIGVQNNYDDVKDLVEVNGKKAYKATKNGKWFIVMEKYEELEIKPHQTIELNNKEDFLFIEEWHNTEGHIISGSLDNIPFKAIDYPMYSVQEGSKEIWIPFIWKEVKCLSNLSVIFGDGESLEGDIGTGIKSSLSTFQGEFPFHIYRRGYSIDIISKDRVLINNIIEILPGGQHVIISNYTENYGNTKVQIQHTIRIKNYGNYSKDSFVTKKINTLPSPLHPPPQPPRPVP